MTAEQFKSIHDGLTETQRAAAFSYLVGVAQAYVRMNLEMDTAKLADAFVFAVAHAKATYPAKP